eukprot:gene720-biopygen4663
MPVLTNRMLRSALSCSRDSRPKLVHTLSPSASLACMERACGGPHCGTKTARAPRTTRFRYLVKIDACEPADSARISTTESMCSLPASSAAEAVNCRAPAAAGARATKRRNSAISTPAAAAEAVGDGNSVGEGSEP